MARGLTLSVLGCLTLLISACSSTNIPEEKPVEVIYTEREKFAPIVPKVDSLKLKDVKWVVVTEENFSEVLSKTDGALFALTPDGYEKLSLNIADLRTLIEQQKRVIGVYEESYR